MLSCNLWHPNLIHAYECCLEVTPLTSQKSSRFNLWIAMEYMDGGSLYYAIQTKLKQDQIAAILKEILNGLAFLHSKVGSFVL